MGLATAAGPAHCRTAQRNGGEPEQTAAARKTMDIIFVGLTFALLGLALGLIRLCERV
jgi:hypothetical protein